MTSPSAGVACNAATCINAAAAAISRAESRRRITRSAFCSDWATYSPNQAATVSCACHGPSAGRSSGCRSATNSVGWVHEPGAGPDGEGAQDQHPLQPALVDQQDPGRFGPERLQRDRHAVLVVAEDEAGRV